MPIPVLFLIQHLNIGGTEDHFHDLVTGLDLEQFEPHVIHFNQGSGYNARRIEAQAGIRTTALSVSRAYDLSGLRAIWDVRRYLRKHKIAAIVTFHFVADFIGTLAAWGNPSVRIISSRRDMGFTRTSRQIKIGRHLARRTSRYIAVSDAVRQAVAHDEYIDPSRIDVIYNGIDLEALLAQHWDRAVERGVMGIAPEELLIGCMANFNPVKGHLTLVEAFARLRESCPDMPLRLLLAGDGPMRSAIEARIAELHLGTSVLMPGNSRTVAREFQMADLVVLPSETEGFSNSIVQAMAFCKPVVACRVGGNPEAVAEGQTGLLVEPKNPVALAAALERLVRDPALRLKFGQAGRERASRDFSKQVMIQTTQQLLWNVTGQKATPQRQPITCSR